MFLSKTFFYKITYFLRTEGCSGWQSCAHLKAGWRTVLELQLQSCTLMQSSFPPPYAVLSSDHSQTDGSWSVFPQPPPSRSPSPALHSLSFPQSLLLYSPSLLLSSHSPSLPYRSSSRLQFGLFCLPSPRSTCARCMQVRGRLVAGCKRSKCASIRTPLGVKNNLLVTVATGLTLDQC